MLEYLLLFRSSLNELQRIFLSTASTGTGTKSGQHVPRRALVTNTLQAEGRIRPSCGMHCPFVYWPGHSVLGAAYSKQVNSYE